MKIIVLAGGIGTRLWPLSRTEFPKQFLRLKTMEQTIFQMTIRRCLLLGKLSDIYILTQPDYKFLVLGQVEEMGYLFPQENILFEPQSKNTLPAIYNGVKEIQKQGNDVVAVFSSDHLIYEEEMFARSIRKGLSLTDEYLVTFGVKPSSPETGYGYIQPGTRKEEGFVVETFREKPDTYTAQQYMDSGFLWNCGLFLFRADLFANQVKEYSPKVYEAFLSDSKEDAFARTPSISIDYGIMEKSDKVAVVELESDWNDLGSFAAFYSAYANQVDNNGNMSLGDECVVVDAHDNMVYSEGDKSVALIGVESLMIVDQRDALLICRKDDAQKVKQAVEQLTQLGTPHVARHLISYRPWGSYTVLEEAENYKIKRLTVLPGKKLSYQMHYHRSEHWIVVKGTARMTLNGDARLVRSGENAIIPAGAHHRIENPGRLLLEVIEVQTGAYLGEDDIERIEDDYGRE